MFTGIVEERGTVAAMEVRPGGAALTIEATEVAGTARPGDSVAVDGVCLTVTRAGGGTLSADVVRETLDRSSLGRLRSGCVVNLERPLPATGRLGGHLVQGHVDGVGEILTRSLGEEGDTVRIGTPPELARYLVPKGSVAVDGVSLTVADRDGNASPPAFTVAVIPTTRALTTLGVKGPGDVVNLEVDVIGKYVDSFVAERVEPHLEGLLDERLAHLLGRWQ